MPSPPKPWEVNNTTAASPVVTSPTTAASLTSAPEIPTRTTDSTTPAMPASYSTTGYGTNAFGSTGYGSTSYGSTGYGGYGSSYGGYGGYGSSYGGGYGGYGSSYGGGYGSYGGYGGGYGMNRFGGGGMNRFGNPMGPDNMSLTQKMEMGTRPTFEVIENIVGSFGGFAQMLDSTFMATHSSFMAMVGVAEQMGYLKNYLGQVFSLFAIYRFAKNMINKVTGRLPTGKPMEMNWNEFESFDRKTTAPKMSRKPLIIFLLIVVGLPYLMHKLIKIISAKQQQQQLTLNGTQQNNPLANIDPAKLEFARAMYDFAGESQAELSLKKGDIVAIISKLDPNTNQQSQWWRGRLRDGTMGMFPANYVEIIQKGGAANDAKEALKEQQVVPATITEDKTKPVV